ncbi:hypothetical protein G6F22_017384 [Rhizopus arrhizus]|nr:hypothetical protein G6F22_017384 [Rhizopus arrhizus]
MARTLPQRPARQAPLLLVVGGAWGGAGLPVVSGGLPQGTFKGLGCLKQFPIAGGQHVARHVAATAIRFTERLKHGADVHAAAVFHHAGQVFTTFADAGPADLLVVLAGLDPPSAQAGATAQHVATLHPARRAELGSAHV